jgi:hypothetical protein
MRSRSLAEESCGLSIREFQNGVDVEEIAAARIITKAQRITTTPKKDGDADRGRQRRKIKV